MESFVLWVEHDPSRFEGNAKIVIVSCNGSYLV